MLKTLSKHTIYIPIFDRFLAVIRGEYDAVKDYINTTHNVDLQPCLGAYTCADNQHFLLLTDSATTMTIIHELTHATYGIIDRIGADVNDQELFCYLYGYLLKEVLQLLNPEILDTFNNTL